MNIIILTIFPEIFTGFLSSSLIHKALTKKQISIECINIRDFASSPHQNVDDTPYGGGAGMVMKPEPLADAIEAAQKKEPAAMTILLSASGVPLDQKKALDLSKQSALILVCGRYEGVDQRIIDEFIDLELSIGDFVMMGGEVAAMAVIEASTRLIDQVIGNEESLEEESFSINSDKGILLEGPHYTRPADFRGMKVPDILLSGDHKKISEWRLEQAIVKTKRNRPELIKS